MGEESLILEHRDGGVSFGVATMSLTPESYLKKLT